MLFLNKTICLIYILFLTNLVVSRVPSHLLHRRVYLQNKKGMYLGGHDTHKSTVLLMKWNLGGETHMISPAGNGYYCIKSLGGNFLGGHSGNK